MKPKLVDVASYLKAEASRIIKGESPPEIVSHRIAVCSSCEFLETGEDEIGFCGSCGCGQTNRARLSNKVKMPNVGCPKMKWGDADSRHPQFKRRFDSLKGKDNG